ncbi:MAG: hypothetical protein KDC85_04030 [Saprospiraceae bacterium]|nr:hypothetical protein [Saprospiraceae bacterium]MCB9324050.1 hypothetical protein [Lewinellaceae bacterium]
MQEMLTALITKEFLALFAPSLRPLRLNFALAITSKTEIILTEALNLYHA